MFNSLYLFCILVTFIYSLPFIIPCLYLDRLCALLFPEMVTFSIEKTIQTCVHFYVGNLLSKRWTEVHDIHCKNKGKLFVKLQLDTIMLRSTARIHTNTVCMWKIMLKKESRLDAIKSGIKQRVHRQIRLAKSRHSWVDYVLYEAYVKQIEIKNASLMHSYTCSLISFSFAYFVRTYKESHIFQARFFALHIHCTPMMNRRDWRIQRIENGSRRNKKQQI